MKRELLIETRTRNGLTQQQVADQCGISRVHYVRIENGYSMPALDLAIKIYNVVTKGRFVLASEYLGAYFNVNYQLEEPQTPPHAEHTNRGTCEDSDDSDLYDDI